MDALWTIFEVTALLAGIGLLLPIAAAVVIAVLSGSLFIVVALFELTKMTLKALWNLLTDKAFA